MTKFSSGVIEKLGFYVYLYADPANSEVFYVGKGRGNRAFAHLDIEDEDDGTESRKSARIRAIRARNPKQEPKIEILIHNLADDEAAFRVEAAVIDVLQPFGHLTNVVRGWGSAEFGRRDTMELNALYAPQKAEIEEPSILIRINQLYQHNMTPQQLYEVTRGVWRMNLDLHDNVKYALAVFDGLVREVYCIEDWGPGGKTPYQTRSFDDVDDQERQEFWGEVAEDKIRQKYFLKSVQHYFAKNAQTPFCYINC